MTVPTDSIGPFYTDVQAARLIDPSGTLISARSIRSEREKGRLIGTMIAGKWVYAHSDIQNFLNSARKCPAQTSVPSSCPDVTPAPEQPFTSRAGRKTGKIEDTASVLAALKKRKPDSRRGSNPGTQKDGPAPVIPIR